MSPSCVILKYASNETIEDLKRIPFIDEDVEDTSLTVIEEEQSIEQHTEEVTVPLPQTEIAKPSKSVAFISIKE